ncbi:hypothetical protein EDD21DRAFT_436135 [Dissophora ornata]|nr:hypothetical protein EDD21DRAFT_436135 [Dissophora ornata]
MSNAPPAVQDWMKSLGYRPREILSALTGVGAALCAKVIAFSDKGAIEVGKQREGWPVKVIEPELAAKINDIVTETNKQGIPNSAGRIANKLTKDGIFRSISSVTRYLRKLGHFWGKGIRQNMMHDAPENVAYRLQYLKMHLDNLAAIGDEFVPIIPEVFLDESYCYLDHAAAKRWVRKGGIVAEPGRKPLLIIFAAFVVYYDQETRKVESKFVKDSVYIWPAIGKVHIKNDSRRSAENRKLWYAPSEIRDAGIIAIDYDYHGNFASVLFDGLFQRLCQNLNVMNLGPCNIHLDGASYHFHKKEIRE